MAPVSPVVHGSSISCRSWLQSPVSVAVHGSSIGFVILSCGSSIISCLQYLTFVAPVSVVRGSGLQYQSIAACGSSGGCCCSCCGSSICCACLQYHYLSLVAPLVVASGSSLLYLLWLQYLSFATPVFSIYRSCGSGISSICRLALWLQYLLCMAPPPVSVACGCRLWLLWLPWSSSFLWL